MNSTVHVEFDENQCQLTRPKCEHIEYMCMKGILLFVQVVEIIRQFLQLELTLRIPMDS